MPGTLWAGKHWLTTKPFLPIYDILWPPGSFFKEAFPFYQSGSLFSVAVADKLGWWYGLMRLNLPPAWLISLLDAAMKPLSHIWHPSVCPRNSLSCHKSRLSQQDQEGGGTLEASTETGEAVTSVWKLTGFMFTFDISTHMGRGSHGSHQMWRLCSWEIPFCLCHPAPAPMLSTAPNPGCLASSWGWQPKCLHLCCADVCMQGFCCENTASNTRIQWK